MSTFRNSREEAKFWAEFVHLTGCLSINLGSIFHNTFKRKQDNVFTISQLSETHETPERKQKFGYFQELQRGSKTLGRVHLTGCLLIDLGSIFHNILKRKQDMCFPVKMK